jgi:hypothetical protein
MGKYKHDMSREKEPNKVLDPGWYDWEIVKVEEKTSKSGNQMFVVSIALSADPQTGMDVYCVAEEGKRWFLKQLLKASEVPILEDGSFDWSEEDLEGKNIQGRVENNQETWIDRQGAERTTTKSKVVEFRKMIIK